MKVISKEPLPLTNPEVLAWLREKSFHDASANSDSTLIKPPRNTISIANSVRKYIETSPAGTPYVFVMFTRIVTPQNTQPLSCRHSCLLC